MAISLKSEYLLDPDIIFLNHGSYGACPRSVFETYQNWQRELERNPVAFIGQRLPALMEDARCKLAAYLGVACQDVVYFTNPTTAFNMVLRSLELNPGDEVLTTDFEYPAMNQAWGYIAHKTGARYIHQSTPLPMFAQSDFTEAFWAGVTEKTRIIFLSHIAPFIAMILPIEEICKRARAAGILTIIDGAHAPSQLPLDLRKIDADIYIGACHKWLSAPKGTGFLYARPAVQTRLEPLVISMGWAREKPLRDAYAPDGRSWLVYFNEGQGTRDPSAFLTVPAAIEYQETRNWQAQRQRCHALAVETRRHINAFTGLPSLCPDSTEFFGQMVSVLLPETDLSMLSKRLFEEFKIVVPILTINEFRCIRLSFQAYNEQADADAVIQALEKILLRS
ncbi:MAG: aminotransferase class V-fold PLP-dependent enzyme [Anaerolineales bacterium]|nr:aminotransferase class V-fold PLP-dependent enzyme [Anaerolineales bacterium]